MTTLLKNFGLLGLYVFLAVCSGPAAARFVSVDPVPANTDNGADFNRYKYANDNPYKFTDPDGRSFTFGGDFIFTAKAVVSLVDVATTDPVLGDRLRTMSASPLEHRINPIGQDQPREAVNPADPRASATQINDGDTASNGKGSATVTWWDPDHHTTAPGADPASGTPNGQMAHDVFGHVYDADRGKDDSTVNPKTGVPRREERAMDMERRYLKGKAEQDKPIPIDPKKKS
ncbi:MAG TPA: hypothetical protein VGH80_07545 [Xanthomonadaceae bacterium]